MLNRPTLTLVSQWRAQHIISWTEVHWLPLSVKTITYCVCHWLLWPPVWDHCPAALSWSWCAVVLKRYFKIATSRRTLLTHTQCAKTKEICHCPYTHTHKADTVLSCSQKQEISWMKLIMAQSVSAHVPHIRACYTRSQEVTLIFQKHTQSHPDTSKRAQADTHTQKQIHTCT